MFSLWWTIQGGEKGGGGGVGDPTGDEKFFSLSQPDFPPREENRSPEKSSLPWLKKKAFTNQKEKNGDLALSFRRTLGEKGERALR